ADADGDGLLTLEEVRLHLAAQMIGKDPRPGSKLEPVRQGPKILKPGDHGVGRQAPDVAFTDVTGKAGKLGDFKDKKAVVVAFTSTSCPLSKKFAPALGRLEKAYLDKGVAFVFVNPVATDEPADIRQAIKSQGLTGPYVHDKDGSLAAALGAGVTTDAFVLDPARTVVYRGAVNDQYGQGYAHDDPRRNFLTDALDAVLAGKTPVIAATEAPGCALDVRKGPATTPVTYHRDVSRLVQAHCVECHRKDGVAPFSLETYKDVLAHAGQVKRVVERGTMPPWFAAPPAKGPTPWVNDRSLAKAEKTDLLAWLAEGKAEGDPADAPRPRAFPSGWQIGTPDAVVRPKKPVQVKAEGTMPYQNVNVETDFGEDKWVQAVEVRPSARQVVHHVLVFVIPPRGAKSDDLSGRLVPNDGLTYYAIYVPGNSATVFPPGFGKPFPKGSRVHFQIHYTPNGTATEDATELGLVFAKEKPKHVVRVLPLVNPGFAIPPGAENHEVTAVVPLPFNAKVLGFLPHMHVRGKAFRYEVTEPGGKPELLLDVPRYDFNWQLLYNYAEPRPVPRGSLLRATGWFDNSSKNPANPDPTKTVRWGLQTYEEMMLGYVEYYIP
ncbi:MAG TPA: redoxin family protein, partial [Gemmataceae bacterium]|nr:redoxin family protein [Gemmataceae bacterium]